MGIAHPTHVPEGSSPDVRFAFRQYLGDDEATWRQYDPVKLVEDFDLKSPGQLPPFLVDQGTDDELYASGVVRPLDFIEACRNKGLPVDFHLRAGYDHSYFYVASVIEEHIDFM